MTSTKARILIVEDEEDVRLYLSAALEDAGFAVVTASNSEEGFSILTRDHPDLVCLDLVMPGRTGMSLFREVRESPALSGIPIVVVSGVNPAEALKRLAGGRDLRPPEAYVEKPVDIGKLIEAVSACLSAGRR